MTVLMITPFIATVSGASPEDAFLIWLWIGLTILFLGFVAMMLPYRVIGAVFRQCRGSGGQWHRRRVRREVRHILNYLGLTVMLPLTVLIVLAGLFGVSRDYLDLVPALPSSVNYVDAEEWPETVARHRDRAALHGIGQGSVRSDGDASGLIPYLRGQWFALSILAVVLMIFAVLNLRYFTAVTLDYGRKALKRRNGYRRDARLRASRKHRGTAAVERGRPIREDR